MIYMPRIKKYERNAAALKGSFGKDSVVLGITYQPYYSGTKISKSKRPQ